MVRKSSTNTFPITLLYAYSELLFVFFNRCKQGKKLLLASLACWVLFTIPLSFIRPEPVKCIERRNETDYVLTYTRTKRDLSAFNMVDSNSGNIELIDEQPALTGVSKITAEEEAEESHIRYIILKKEEHMKLQINTF